MKLVFCFLIFVVGCRTGVISPNSPKIIPIQYVTQHNNSYKSLDNNFISTNTCTLIWEHVGVWAAPLGFSVWASTDLINWTMIETGLNPTNRTYKVNNVGNYRYFRVSTVD